ncbi:MAG: hypothetical protein WBN94_13665 [Methanothrix sp.]
MSAIPECPAYEICRAHKSDCSICEKLDVPAWQTHVRKVLKKEEA